MLTDPPQLVGKRVRFIVVVKDQHGKTERVRVRVWTDGNIKRGHFMNEEYSQAIAVEFYLWPSYSARYRGDVEVIPKIVEAEGH